MVKYIKKNKSEDILYNNILLLSRNKLFYTNFDLSDVFQNRIHLIFIHISFLFIKIKQNTENIIYKEFYQNMFDLIFTKIDLNMREIGFGDVTINKNMRHLVKTFYNILLTLELYKNMTLNEKTIFLRKFLTFKEIEKTSINKDLVNYFDKYQAFCFDLSSNSILKGELKFNFTYK